MVSKEQIPNSICNSFLPGMLTAVNDKLHIPTQPKETKHME